MGLRVIACFSKTFAGNRSGDGEVAIEAVWNHRLTWLELDLDAVDLDGDYIRLE